MGNILGPSNGIVKQGEVQALHCEKCHDVFIDYVGTITIKGPSPTPTKCKVCKEADLQSLLKAWSQPQQSYVQEPQLPKDLQN